MFNKAYCFPRLLSLSFDADFRPWQLCLGLSCISHAGCCSLNPRHRVGGKSRCLEQQATQAAWRGCDGGINRGKACFEKSRDKSTLLNFQPFVFWDSWGPNEVLVPRALPGRTLCLGGELVVSSRCCRKAWSRARHSASDRFLSLLGTVTCETFRDLLGLPYSARHCDSIWVWVFWVAKYSGWNNIYHK